MGVNLIGLRSLPGTLGASGLRVRPSGSSGRLGRRSTPPCRDLIVNAYNYRDQSAKMHTTTSNKIQLTTKPTLRVDHDFRRIMKLVS